MIVKPRHFPYPVLTPFNDQEIYDFSCKLELEEKVELDIIRFKVHYTLNNETIRSLINEERAVFGLHIECPSTMTRTLLTTTKTIDVFDISIHDLNKTVELNYFILANEDISHYENIEIDPYSEGFTFDLSKGDLLAIGPSEVLDIEKEPIVDVNSIFELVPDLNKNAKPLLVDLSASKIRIHIPKANFDQLATLHKSVSKMDSILSAIYYIPAMIEALRYIHDAYHSDDDSLIEDIQDAAWFRSIKARFDYHKIDITKLSSDNIIGIAHEVLDDPNKKAMDSLQELIIGDDLNYEIF